MLVKITKTGKKNVKFKKVVQIDDFDTWSCDTTLSAIIYPLLTRFREVNNGFPYKFTEQSWNEALDKMIIAFKLMADESVFDFFYDETHIHFNSKEEVAKIRAIMDEGLLLFAQNFRELGW